jgi:hypothetical protein
MCLTIVLFVFGITALIKGEFNVTNERKVRGIIVHILGIVLLLGAASPLIHDYGGIIQIAIFIGVIIAGLATSEKIEQENSGKRSPVDLMATMNFTVNIIFRWIVPVGLVIGIVVFFFRTILNIIFPALGW